MCGLQNPWVPSPPYTGQFLSREIASFYFTGLSRKEASNAYLLLKKNKLLNILTVPVAVYFNWIRQSESFSLWQNKTATIIIIVCNYFLIFASDSSKIKWDCCMVGTFFIGHYQCGFTSLKSGPISNNFFIALCLTGFILIIFLLCVPASVSFCPVAGCNLKRNCKELNRAR